MYFYEPFLHAKCQVLIEVGVHNRPTALHVQHSQVVSPELDAIGTVGLVENGISSVVTDHDLIMDDIHQVRTDSASLF